jgi:hypothetical protein
VDACAALQLGLHPSHCQVVLASAISDVFISHYSVDEILEFGELLPPFLAANTHPWMLRGLLAVETGLSYLGLRPLLRMTPLKGLAHLNGYAGEVASTRHSRVELTSALRMRTSAPQHSSGHCRRRRESALC